MPSIKPAKVHTSALAWLPADSAQPPIQALRRKHDKQIDRWPPHVNILYPFVPEKRFEEAATCLAEALRAQPSFPVSLGNVNHFQHSKNSITAWLKPREQSDAARWREVQAACLAAFPHCTEQTSRGEFVPHLTVGQFTQLCDVAALDGAFEPVECEVADLCLISRAGPSDPFEVQWRVPLGGGAPVRVAAAPDAAGAAAPSPPSTVRVTLACNANRAVRAACLVDPSASLPQLSALSEKKLRVPRAKLFFRESGAPLGGGEPVAPDELLLVSKGEPFVGVVRTSEPPPLPPLAPAAGGGYARAWEGAPGAPGAMRLLSWNILAGVLASGAKVAQPEALASAESASEAKTEAAEASEAVEAADGQPEATVVDVADGITVNVTDGAAAAASTGSAACADVTDARSAACVDVTVNITDARSADCVDDAAWEAGVRYLSGKRGRETHQLRCPHAALEWAARAPLVARELHSANAALLCLQACASDCH